MELWAPDCCFSGVQHKYNLLLTMLEVGLLYLLAPLSCKDQISHAFQTYDIDI